MSAPTFDRIPLSLWNNAPEPRDNIARGHLRILNKFIAFPRGRGHGSWGYTILRTAYGPQADALFPVAVDRLCSYVHYWCHYGRFTSYGAQGEQYRVDGAAPNEELVRRLYFEVIEDEERLAHLDRNGDGDGDGDGASGDGKPEGSADDAEKAGRFAALADYFRRWAASVDTGDMPEDNPRFTVGLVIDSECMAVLAGLPAELPPLRLATTTEEKRKFLSTGESAWLWLLETDYMAEPELHEDAYRGWMKVAVPDIESAWFTRLNRDSQDCFFHEEIPRGSGIYYWASLPPYYGEYE